MLGEVGIPGRLKRTSVDRIPETCTNLKCESEISPKASLQSGSLLVKDWCGVFYVVRK